MNSDILRNFALSILLIHVGGCAATANPFQRVHDYPAEWPDAVTMDAECTELNGIYINSGTLVDSEGIVGAGFLGALLLPKIRPEASSMGLRVETIRKTSDDLTVATLLVGREAAPPYIGQLSDCFCIRGALLCAGVSRSSEGALHIGLVASQRNVWLTKASDGSLLMKISDEYGGIIVIVPFYKRSLSWARFPRLVE